MVAVTQHSFAAGELSPGFWGRTDHPRFKYGVKSAVNMIVSQHGSLRKRPGMEHYYDLNAPARVFTIGTSSGPLLAALFRDKIVIIGSRANPQTLNIGENFYSESDLYKVQICQLGDTVTLVLPGHMPLEILNTNGIFTIRNRPGCYRDNYIANSAFTNSLKYNLLCWYQFEGDYKESLSDTTPTFYQAGDATFVSGGKPDSGKALKISGSAEFYTNLTHHWSFGDGSSWDGASSVPEDTITISKGTYFSASSSGIIGGCASNTNVNTSGTGVSASVPGIGSTDYSAAIWFKRSSSSTQYANNVNTILSAATIGDRPAGGAWFGLGLSKNGTTDQVPAVGYGDTSLEFSVKGTQAVANDEWHLLVVTIDHDSAVVTLYCDGVAVGTGTAPAALLAGTSTTTKCGLGRAGTTAGCSRSLIGSMDEFSIWYGRALSADEVSALWNGGAGLPYSQMSGGSKGTVFTEASSPDLSDLSNFSVSFWMKIDADAFATYITPFSIGPELCLYVSSGSSQIGLIFDGNGYDTYVPINSDAWTHVVVQGYPTGGAFPWSPFRLELYVNGSLVWSTTCPRPTDQAYSRLALGCLNGAANTDAFVSGYSFIGEMDAIGVWKRRLNLSEIETLYNSGAGIFFSSTVPNKTINDAVVTVKLKENIDYTLEALVPDPAYLWHKDSFYDAKLTHCPEDYDHPKLPWMWRFGFVYESPERGEFEAISEDYTLQMDAACYNDYHKHYIYVKVPTDTPSGMTLKALKVYRGRNGIFGLVERAESDDIIDYFQYYSSDNLETAAPSLVTVSGDNYWCVIDDVSIPDLSQQPPVPLEYNDRIFTESSSLPNSIGWFEQRAVFGGHASKPRTLYMSKTGQRYEFTKNGAYSPLDSDAMALDLATAEHENITAVTALGGRLIVLTDKNLWACGSTGQAMTPSDASAVCYNGIGCNGLKPLALRNSLLFVSQHGNEIYEIRADQNGSQWATRELGTFARHLLDGHKIVSWDYQSTPDPIVWLVREDGVLLSLTYNAETELCAWTRHATNAAVKSVACSGTDVWLSVVRNGHWQAERMNMSSESNYLDGMKVVSSLEIANSLGLHVWNRFTAARTLPLEGSEKLEVLPVWATSDGQCLAGDAVESTVELLDAVSFEDVGLRPKTLKKISVDFISNSSLSLSENLKGRSSPERLSGTSERRIEFAHIIHGYGAEATGFIRSSQPCPLTILGVAREVDFGDSSMPGADRN